MEQNTVDTLREIMDRMVITVRSPDKLIEARLTNRTCFEVSFSDGAYDEYEEDNLRYQIEKLCQLFWTAQRRGEREALKTILGSGFSFVDQSESVRDPKYLEERDNMELGGSSSSEKVQIFTRGFRQWRIELTEGIQNDLSETEFVNELLDATQDLLADHREVLTELHDRYR